MAEYKIDPEIFRQDVAVSPSNLQQAFQEHAGLFAFYAACHVEAMRNESKAKIMLDVKRATAAKRFREEMMITKDKVTESMIDQAVATDPEVIRARLTLSEAEAMTQMAWHAVEAFRQRRDMLIQMGASEREEKKGAPVIRAPVDDRLRAAFQTQAQPQN